MDFAARDHPILERGLYFRCRPFPPAAHHVMASTCPNSVCGNRASVVVSVAWNPGLKLKSRRRETAVTNHPTSITILTTGTLARPARGFEISAMQLRWIIQHHTMTSDMSRLSLFLFRLRVDENHISKSNSRDGPWPMCGSAGNNIYQIQQSVSGLVVKSIVAIDGPRVRFAADALLIRE